MMTSRDLPSDSTGVLKAEPCKLDIKRRESGILFVSLPIVSLLKPAILVIFSIFVLNMEHTQNSTMGAAIHNESTITGPPP